MRLQVRPRVLEAISSNDLLLDMFGVVHVPEIGNLVDWALWLRRPVSSTQPLCKKSVSLGGVGKASALATAKSRLSGGAGVGPMDVIDSIVVPLEAGACVTHLN